MGKKLPAQSQTTSKKVKYAGFQQFVNVQTGEVEQFQVMNVEERDFNFSKVWLRSFLQTMDLLGTQRIRVATWICDNINRDNQLLCTFREIAEQTNTSLETVRLTMKVLQDEDFLRKQHAGLYTINPEIIFRGTHAARLGVLHEYQQLGQEKAEPTKEEKIQHIQASINLLQKELEKLTKPEELETEMDPQFTLSQDGQEIIEKTLPVKAKRAKK